MLFDIPITIQLEADNELEAEKLTKDIMDETTLLENKIISWNFLKFTEENPQDVLWET